MYRVQKSIPWRHFYTQGKLILCKQHEKLAQDSCIWHQNDIPGLHDFDHVLWLLFNRSVMSDYLGPHGLQHIRLPYPSPFPRACSNSCPLSWWCHPTISSSDVPFSSCLQSFPASGSFPMSQLFTLGGQSTAESASASVLSMTIQGWFPLGLTCLILQSKGLSSLYTVQKHQFFSIQPSLWSNSYIHTLLLEKSKLWLDRPLLAK